MGSTRARLRLLPLAALLVGPASVAAQPLFHGVEIETTSLRYAPFAFSIHDFDEDGRMDVAVTHNMDARITVLLNGPDGRLTASDALDVGLSPIAIASGDLEGDGHADLLVCDSGSSTVSVLRGLGRGSFGPTIATTVPEPRAIQLGDIDGDSVLDAAVAANLGGERGALTILRGDGRGGFKAPRHFDVGDDPHAVSVADFDRDGLLDVAVAQTQSIAWFHGLAGGDFERVVQTPLDSNPRFLAAGDIDEGGRLDLAVLVDQGALGVLHGLPSGEFEPRWIASVGVGAQKVSAGPVVRDLDGDGQLDVLVQSQRVAEFGLSFYQGDGRGGFTLADELPLGGQASDVALDDIDGDGIHDVVEASPEGRSIIVFRRPSRGRLNDGLAIPLEKKPIRAVLAHDGGGSRRIVAASAGALHIVLPEAGRGFAPPVVHEVTRVIVDLIAADLDGVPGDEVAIVDLSGGSVLLLALDGPADVRDLQTRVVGNAPRGIEAADFDGDGALDLAVGDAATSSVVVLHHPASGETESTPVPAGAPPTAFAAADWNGDGKQDLAIATRSGVRLYLGDGATFSAGRAFANAGDVADLASGDLDGDGEADLLAAGRPWISVRYDVARQGEIKEDVIGIAVDEFRSVLALDADGDGREDAVALATHPFPRVTVSRRKPGGGFAPLEGHLTGLDPRSLVVADLDGDGRVDAMTANSAGSELRVLWGTGPAPAARFRRGDVDGSGAVELTDAVALLLRLFAGAGDLPCDDAADADDDGSLDITDAVWILAHLFQGGPAPPDPGPEACGPDPTADDLACASGGACR